MRGAFGTGQADGLDLHSSLDKDGKCSLKKNGHFRPTSHGGRKLWRQNILKTLIEFSKNTDPYSFFLCRMTIIGVYE